MNKYGDPYCITDPYKREMLLRQQQYMASQMMYDPLTNSARAVANTQPITSVPIQKTKPNKKLLLTRKTKQ